MKPIALILFFLTIAFSSQAAFAQKDYSSNQFGFHVIYDSTVFSLHVESNGWLLFRCKTSYLAVTLQPITIARTDPIRDTTMILATSNDTLSAVAFQKARQLCDADGDYGSTYCSDIVNLTKSRSQSGLPVFKFDLVYVNPSQPKRTTGPFYFVDISTPGFSRGLLLSAEIGMSITRSEALKYNALVQSISLLTVRPDH